MPSHPDSPALLPPELRGAIARDLAPVRPLPPPAARTAWVAPLGLLLLVASAAAFGLRPDAVRLGWVLTWGASAAEMTLGLLLVGAALREAIPGTTLSRRALGYACGAALLSIVVVTLITWRTSGLYHIRPGREWFIWRICFAGTLASALPPLLVSAWLVARAFPLRPAVAGLLYGIGAGLMADAGWRLFCHFSDPAHVFGAHLAAVAASALIGSQLGSLLGRR
jgi:hypothetical protein